MADWLHCNTCFCQPGDGIKFFLTNCGHMYCEECMQKMSGNGKCYMCKSKYTTTPLSNAEMSPENAVFLSNPITLLNNNFENLQKTLMVMKFQQNHRQRFTVHLREKVSRLSNFVSQSKNSIQRMQEYEAQVSKLKEENSNLKKKYSDSERQVSLLKEEISYLKRVWGKGGNTPGRTSPRTSPNPVSKTAVTPRNRGSPVSTQPDATAHKPYLSRTSPCFQPVGGKNVSQMPYHSPNVTTGRVLVKTPPCAMSRTGVPHETPVSWSRLHTPLSAPARRPHTPGNSCRTTPTNSPMDLGKDSPQGSSCSQITRSQTPGAYMSYPSRLR